MLPTGKINKVQAFSDSTKAWGDLLLPHASKIIKMYESSYSTNFENYEYFWLDEDFKSLVISTSQPMIGRSYYDNDEEDKFTLSGYGTKYVLDFIEYEALPEEQTSDLIRNSIIPIKTLMKYWGM